MTGKRLPEEKYQGLGISEEVIKSGMREGDGGIIGTSFLVKGDVMSWCT